MKYLATALAALLAIPAHAQDNCGAADQVEQMLVQKYGEHITGFGVEGGVMYRFWANDATGTWTILRTNGEFSCMMASGAGGAGAGIPVTPEPNL